MANRAMREWRPGNLAEYVEVIEQVQAQAAGPVWYRGCSQNSAKLLPSLYRERENQAISPTDLSELEAQLVARFRERSLPYHTRSLDDDLETLFFMQHYSIPTRLLDWTENPFVGLFFALRGVARVRDARGLVRFAEDAVVWILDPSAWNQGAMQHQSYAGGPLSPSHASLVSYKPVGEIAKLGENPVALYGAHNSQRIVVQQGTFVIFGSLVTPMEVLYRKGDFAEDCLTRVIISKGRIAGLRRSLFSHGFTEGSLFPYLDGLGRDLRRSLGFEI